MRWSSLAAILLLAACDDAPQARQRAAVPEAKPAVSPRETAALQAAEERVRARLRAEGPLTLRAVAVHRQALADTVAVCGQVNASGRGDEPFIPFVAVVGFEGEAAARTEFHFAGTSPEATRVYFEMVDRCHDGGGPVTTRAMGRPLPPAPVGLPREAEPGLVATGAAFPPGIAGGGGAPGSVAFGSVVTSLRSPANLRAAPSGGGAVLRTVPRGSALQVFGEAPGGWLQVGDGEPWGWVHGSLIEPR